MERTSITRRTPAQRHTAFARKRLSDLFDNNEATANSATRYLALLYREAAEVRDEVVRELDKQLVRVSCLHPAPYQFLVKLAVSGRGSEPAEKLLERVLEQGDVTNKILMVRALGETRRDGANGRIKEFARVRLEKARNLYTRRETIHTERLLAEIAKAQGSSNAQALEAALHSR